MAASRGSSPGRIPAAGWRPPASFTSAAYAPDGARVVAGLRDSTARLWDVVSGDMLGGVAHDGPVTTVAFAPTATGSRRDPGRHLRDRHDRSRFGALGHEYPPAASGPRAQDSALSVASRPDGRRPATAGEDARHDLRRCRRRRPPAIRGHDAAVTSVAFSPDGTVVTASEDATARVWDIVDGRERFVFAGHGGPVTAATFAPDGSRIATASSDGTVRLWQETGVEELLRAADQRLGERLSADDRLHFGLAERAGPPLTRVADLPSFADVDRDALGSGRARAVDRGGAGCWQRRRELGSRRGAAARRSQAGSQT